MKTKSENGMSWNGVDRSACYEDQAYKLVTRMQKEYRILRGNFKEKYRDKPKDKFKGLCIWLAMNVKQPLEDLRKGLYFGSISEGERNGIVRGNNPDFLRARRSLDEVYEGRGIEKINPDDYGYVVLGRMPVVERCCFD